MPIHIIEVYPRVSSLRLYLEFSVYCFLNYRLMFTHAFCVHSRCILYHAFSLEFPGSRWFLPIFSVLSLWTSPCITRPLHCAFPISFPCAFPNAFPDRSRAFHGRSPICNFVFVFPRFFFPFYVPRAFAMHSLELDVRSAMSSFLHSLTQNSSPSSH